MHHVQNQHRIRVAAPAVRAFQFFTPTGEELWVEGWHPSYIVPPDGHTEQGMVFTTGAGAEFTIWQLADYDEAKLRSRYVRTTPALRTGFVEIACAPVGDNETEVTVTYTMTALTPEGVVSLDPYRGDAFRKLIDGWAERIAAHLPALLAAAGKSAESFDSTMH
jgi:hypothetical protein